MIPSITRRTTRALRLFGMLGAAFALPIFAQAHVRGRTVTLGTGNVIAVKLDNALNSNEATKGDKFTATVKYTGSSSDPYALPEGTQVQGVVREARAKKDKNPGVLDLAFRRLVLPDGHSYNLNGSLIGLDNKSVSRDKSGRLIAKKGHQTNRLTYVGYGAGAGVIVGLLTDRKNTLRDTAIGGALGYLYGALEKDKSKVNDVRLKQGDEFGVRLDSPVSYTASR